MTSPRLKGSGGRGSGREGVHRRDHRPEGGCPRRVTVDRSSYPGREVQIAKKWACGFDDQEGISEHISSGRRMAKPCWCSEWNREGAPTRVGSTGPSAGLRPILPRRTNLAYFLFEQNVTVAHPVVHLASLSPLGRAVAVRRSGEEPVGLLPARSLVSSSSWRLKVACTKDRGRNCWKRQIVQSGGRKPSTSPAPRGSPGVAESRKAGVSHVPTSSLSTCLAGSQSARQ